ncbi:MAG: hypothetical protein AAF243_06580 [Cyanobacteria bacterium P01_A01_bin.137]
MPMACLRSHPHYPPQKPPMATANPILTAGSTLAIGLQLSHPVLAHNGELHGQEAAPETPAPAVTNTNPDTNPSDNRPATAVVESVPEADQSTALSLDSLPIGPGDLLFSLMVVFPWALIVLRKQLHLPHRP